MGTDLFSSRSEAASRALAAAQLDGGLNPARCPWPVARDGEQSSTELQAEPEGAVRSPFGSLYTTAPGRDKPEYSASLVFAKFDVRLASGRDEGDLTSPGLGWRIGTAAVTLCCRV